MFCNHILLVESFKVSVEVSNFYTIDYHEKANFGPIMAAISAAAPVQNEFVRLDKRKRKIYISESSPEMDGDNSEQSGRNLMDHCYM